MVAKQLSYICNIVAHEFVYKENYMEDMTSVQRGYLL